MGRYPSQNPKENIGIYLVEITNIIINSSFQNGCFNFWKIKSDWDFPSLDLSVIFHICQEISNN